MSIARLRWILVPAAACAALAGFWLAHELDREAPTLASGTWLPQPKALPDFQLLDDRGRPYTTADLTSAPTLVYFGFTHCPDVCPTTLVKLAQIERQAALPGLRVVLVSVDPQRDTPPLLSRYVHAFDPSFSGLTGSPQEIARVARDFGVAVNRVDLPGGDYTMDHSAIVFLVARAGVVAIFTPPYDPPAFAADLRRAAAFLTPRKGWHFT
ncbi:MAG TPA: SCO family protein [Steroidobacteraceae bacterium]|jgi:protein SCO1/2|nr:SCO family protein [Steroidobacteraceae bacterium]